MKTVATICVLLALVIGSNPVRSAETGDKPRVGPLREFDRFTFEGNTTFPARSLWLRLNNTFDFPELSHPLAPRDPFLAAIESHLRLGYERGGFPSARITAKYDATADRVVVRITEGTRYRCDSVEIIGARKIAPPPILKALTAPMADTGAWLQTFQFLDNAPANRTEGAEINNTVAWSQGQPAPFDQISQRSLASRVRHALGQQGFFQSRFSLQVATNAATRTATLQVNIAEEGPPASIDQIKVVGNRKNDREALLNYLDLKPGVKFTTDLAAAINDRLYHSARFLTNSVLAGVPDSSGRLQLTIDVLESDDSPPLASQFDPMEKTMLQARDWLANLGNTAEEAVISVSGYAGEALSLECILAPRQGLLMLENEASSGTNRLRHALIVSTNQIALYVPRLQQKYLTSFSAEQFKSYVTVETGAPGADGHTANLLVGAGLQSLNDATNLPPYALSMSLAPAAFVRLAHPKDHTNWFADGQLIFSNASACLKLEAKTGRLVAFALTSGESRHGQINLRFAPGAFAPALAGLERAGSGFTNVCRTNAPFSSALVFFGSELVQLPFVDSYLQTKLPAAVCAQLPALLRQLGNEDFLSPFDVFKDFSAATKNPAENFQIPEDPRPASGGALNAEIATLSQEVLASGDLIFPPRSWPWTNLREIALLLRGQQTYLQPDMDGILSSEATGPVGCLVSAEFLKTLGFPSAKNMAQRGLQQLSAEGFRRAYRLLLDEHYVAGQFVARLAASLGDLYEPQLHALTVPMNVAQAECVRDCAQRLRAAKPGQTLVETIAPALDAYWAKDLKQNLATQLRKIASE